MVVATTVTATDGAYLFEDVPTGTYLVVVGGVPVGWSVTFDLDGGGDGVAKVTLGSGNAVTGVDFVYFANSVPDLADGFNPVITVDIGEGITVLAQAVTGGSLPFTGSDLVALIVLGMLLVLTGAGLTRIRGKGGRQRI